MKLQLTRNVTPKECSWLHRTFEKGQILFKYYGCTYGCVSGNGIACSEKEDETPFFELPINSIKIIKE